MTLPSRLAATLAIASLVACRAATPPTPPTSSAPVVVISIDTLMTSLSVEVDACTVEKI